jgi:putative transcriptional regulator
MEELKVKIAGEISLSQDPGSAMKKWREIFNVSQSELSKYLKISPSTISDYESNRRKSPGIGVIRRFVDALFAIDATRGGELVKRFKEADGKDDFFEVFNFLKAISGRELAKAIDAKPVANAEKLDSVTVYGCTLLDSIKVILEMPYSSFVKIYSTTSQRALLFTHVETGRSPMVAIRVSPIKPAIVILHDLTDVDKLAVKIAESEGIPLLATKKGIDEVKQKLKELGG